MLQKREQAPKCGSNEKVEEEEGGGGEGEGEGGGGGMGTHRGYD
jgi:hypothetical protein